MGGGLNESQLLLVDHEKKKAVDALQTSPKKEQALNEEVRYNGPFWLVFVATPAAERTRASCALFERRSLCCDRFYQTTGLFPSCGLGLG